MKFDEIVSRLTGISVPIFGISWNPPETERKIARRVIAFLKNRRVLYAPFPPQSVRRPHAGRSAPRPGTTSIGALIVDGKTAL